MSIYKNKAELTKYLTEILKNYGVLAKKDNEDAVFFKTDAQAEDLADLLLTQKKSAVLITATEDETYDVGMAEYQSLTDDDGQRVVSLVKYSDFIVELEY